MTYENELTYPGLYDFSLGHMAVFKEFSKGKDLSKCTLYDPLYDPGRGQTGEVQKMQRDLKDLAGLVSS